MKDKPSESPIHVRVEGAEGTDPVLVQRFAHFALSHPEDIARSLDVNASLLIEIVPGAGPMDLVRQEEGARLRLSERHSARQLCAIDAREHGHGMMIIPTLYALHNRGLLQRLNDGAPHPLEDLARHSVPDAPERNLGYLRGVMRALTLYGWAELSGMDRHSQVQVTEQGRCVFDLVQDHIGALAAAVQAIPNLKRYYQLFRADAVAADVLDQYRALVERSRQGWGLPSPKNQREARALRHLVRYLDALIMNPTATALGMPRYEEQSGRQVEVSPGLFDLVDKATWQIRRDALKGAWEPNMLAAALQLLEHHGLIVSADAEPIQLTTHWQARPTDLGYGRRDPFGCGRSYVQNNGAASVGGATSYLPMFEHIEQSLFGDPDPLGLGLDKHVDRLMNIWGVGVSVSIQRAARISSTWLRRIFHDLPLDQQPAGIADMGSGSGLPLEHMARYVIRETMRGQHLDTYPLTIIAADYNEASRQRSAEVLRSLDPIEGVHTAVVYADVTNPQEYDETIRACKLPGRNGEAIGAGDLLHTLFHLTHERKILVPDDASARALLGAAMDRVDPKALALAMAQSSMSGALMSGASNSEAPLPADRQARLDQLMAQFTTTGSYRGALISAARVGADLVDFLRRWASFCRHGMIVVELHSPRPESLKEEIPESIDRFMRFEKLGHTYWQSQHLSDQYVVPYVEYALASVLAGLRPVHGPVEGGGLFTQAVPQTMDRGNGCYETVD